MRTSKYPSHAVSIFREAIENGNSGLALSERDLFFEMNDQLNRDEHICFRTFQRYKEAVLAHGEDAVEETAEFDPIYETLWHTLQRNIIAQKKDLFEQLMDSTGTQWQKFRWMLEDKFPDLNMKVQTETFKTEHKAIQQLQKGETKQDGQINKKETPAAIEQTKPATGMPRANRMRIVDGNDIDWTKFADQHLRIDNPENSDITEPLNEEPVPQPAPFTRPIMEVQRELEEQAELENGTQQIKQPQPIDNGVPNNHVPKGSVPYSNPSLPGVKKIIGLG